MKYLAIIQLIIRTCDEDIERPLKFGLRKIGQHLPVNRRDYFEGVEIILRRAQTLAQCRDMHRLGRRRELN